MSNFPNIEQVLQDGGDRIVLLMVNALQEKGAIFQGELARSIQSNVTSDNDSMTLTIEMLERGEFLDKGVNGTAKTVGTTPFQFRVGPPIDPLRTWARVKGFNVYALRNSIAKNGIAPRNFIQPSLEEGIRWMESKFEEAGQKDIEATISLVGKESKIEVR